MNRRRQLTMLVVTLLLMLVGTFTAQAATKIKAPKKLNVVVGFPQTIEVYEYETDDPDFQMDADVKSWKTSNKKIATVNKYGEVTGKKAGTCKITYKVNGKKYTTTVKVKANEYRDKAKYSVLDFRYGEPGVVIRRAYYSGKTLVLNITVYHNRRFRMTKFDWLTLKLYNKDTGKTYVTKKYRNLKCSVPAYGTKNITLKIPMKKKYDLTKDFGYEDDYVYTYVY